MTLCFAQLILSSKYTITLDVVTPGSYSWTLHIAKRWYKPMTMGHITNLWPIHLRNFTYCYTLNKPRYLKELGFRLLYTFFGGQRRGGSFYFASDLRLLVMIKNIPILIYSSQLFYVVYSKSRNLPVVKSVSQGNSN